jgi:hypothetical protein
MRSEHAAAEELRKNVSSRLLEAGIKAGFDWAEATAIWERDQQWHAKRSG